MSESSEEISVPEVEVKNWEMFTVMTKLLDVSVAHKTSYLFRGQANTNWSLLPSFSRHAVKAGLDSTQALELEDSCISTFQKQAHLHLSHTSHIHKKDLFGWAQIMQHHQAPTRLLDWTLSPFVALYFAVNTEPHEPGAVWLIHIHTVQEQMKKTFPNYKIPETVQDGTSALLDDTDTPRIYFLEPQTQTNRMVAQRTAYSAASRILSDHHQILASTIPKNGGKEIYKKVVIPPELKSSFLQRLRQVNITAGTLFPVVDGLGRSITELVSLSCSQLKKLTTQKEDRK